jgi:uncharacterized damage-inducible protein DinB
MERRSAATPPNLGSERCRIPSLPPGRQWHIDRVHKPGREVSDPTEQLLGFIDYYRSAVIRKVEDLSDAELRASRVPSGWTPLELINHLRYMERRWFAWGFLAETVDDPHGDKLDGRWTVAADESLAELTAALRATGERTREIVSAAALNDVAKIGGRFRRADEAPTLGWILVYVLQEYARHAGHLDVARELIDGTTGE